ncbi:5'-methylthioadenosine/S-adenosylhomocysteine nucleosidase [Promicromonospora kroppenstedtii]|uniref:5'-methylthioadenosine/S-adenosylhomocysteine nucleosidase family protein n=1 Tax=Promicromonospora kroppenstedtii TaxID=440482 RepID=UPI0004B65887|nr:5'-methylthioadenosine/S-adenosylhomocysteine nucleosidase [Promicromonospora kroppenstedtii]
MTDARVVVVLTALDLEYKAVRKHLKDIEQHRHSTGTRFEIGTVEGTDCRIAVGLVGVGNSNSAVLAERAIQQFSPVAALFVGVAGAVWDSTPLGQVVVADRVFAYHGGTSEDDGFKARPSEWKTSHHLSQLAHHLERSGTWAARLPLDAHMSDGGRPSVMFGAIAAGEVVLNSRVSVEARRIHEHYNNATAIEMEAAGIAHAGHLNSAPVAIIRGISDRADGEKTSANDGTWQPRAAAHAAAFAIELAVELANEAEETPMTPNEPRPTPPSTTVNNTASGNVGIQAANVTGSSVWMSAAPHREQVTDPTKALAELRALLDAHRADGAVDEETYDAAKSGLVNAETALRDPDAKGKKKAVIALRQFGGLVGHLTDLAAKTAVVITALNGIA